MARRLLMRVRPAARRSRRCARRRGLRRTRSASPAPITDRRDMLSPRAADARCCRRQRVRRSVDRRWNRLLRRVGALRTISSILAEAPRIKPSCRTTRRICARTGPPAERSQRIALTVRTWPVIDRLDERRDLARRPAQLDEVVVANLAMRAHFDQPLHDAHAEARHAQHLFLRCAIEVDRKPRAVTKRPRFRTDSSNGSDRAGSHGGGA
jgi:hypothetical protein